MLRQVRLAGSSLGIKGLEVSCFSVATCGNKVHTHTVTYTQIKAIKSQRLRFTTAAPVHADTLHGKHSSPAVHGQCLALITEHRLITLLHCCDGGGENYQGKQVKTAVVVFPFTLAVN